MILINLLPLEFRKQAARRGIPWLRGKPGQIVGIIFLGLTAIFYLQYLFGAQSVRSLQSQWLGLQKEVQRVGQIRKEIESGVKGEKDFLAQYAVSSFPLTSILNAVNALLPDSIWLIELRVSQESQESTLLLKGLSRASPRNSSLEDVEKYVRDLKERFPPGTNLLLTTSRQQKDSFELTLFTAVFSWS